MLITAAVPAIASSDAGGTVSNFKVKNLAGKNVELKDLLTNGPVLIDFWATWCKPCLRELPHVEKLRLQYEEQGLTVVAVSVDQTRSLSKVKSYIKTHKYGFEVLLDPNQRLLRQLKGSTVPYLLIVSPERQKLYVHSGYREGDEKELAERVAEIMADYAISEPGEEEAPAATGEETDAET
jgi:peroxiredoxin